MSSYISKLNKYSTQLDQVINEGYKFTQTGVEPPNYNGPILTKTKVLENIFSDIQKAPIYYLSKDLSVKFVEQINKFIKNVSEKEKNGLKNTAKKINRLVEERERLIERCFMGKQAEQINNILDKKIEDISDADFLLLCDLANIFAYYRKSAQLFYKKVALIEKTEDLLQKHPSISIQITEKGWVPCIAWTLPSNILELHFALFIHLKLKHRDSQERDLDLLKEVVQRKEASSDPYFKDLLNSFLLLYSLDELSEQWDQLSSEVLNTKCEKEILEPYVLAFISHPPALINLNSDEKSEFYLFDGKGKEYRSIANDLFALAEETNKEFDLWYKAIYSKIVEHKQVNDKPVIMKPQDFIGRKDFISKNDICYSNS